MSQEVCHDFVQSIKHYFGYLFSQHEFKVIQNNSYRSGEKCLVVLESCECRLKFIYDRGRVETLVGTTSAPAELSDLYDGIRSWYSLRGVIEYVNNAPPLTSSEARELGNLLFRMSADELLEYSSNALLPICDQVVGLFEKETFRSRQSEFDQFYNR